MKKQKEIFSLFWPIAAAMFLTSALSLIDSAMISNYNLLGISAISVATQIQFFFGPMYFGILSGINIYSVQYNARGEFDKLKQFAGLAITFLIPLALINFLVLTFFGSQIVASYVPINSEVYTLAIDYIFIFKFSLLLLPVDMFFMYQYRAIKRPKVALYMNVSQAVLNIIFNYFLIFGHGPFNEYGIMGAAMGTFLARLIIVIANLIVAYRMHVPFIGHISEMMGYERKLLVEVFLNTLPLILIELAFGVGNIIYTKIYATTSIAGFTAFNVSKTISFTINALVIATANVSGIMLGSLISGGMPQDKVMQETKHMMRFIKTCSASILVISIFILPLFIPIFGVMGEGTATVYKLLIINGLWMSIRVFSSSFLAILKSGNDNGFVMVIEIFGTYAIGIPLAIVFALMGLDAIVILRSTIILDALTKASIGYFRFRQGKWINQV